MKCPYCLANISIKAEVCRYCNRDIGRLVRAEQQVKELLAEKSHDEDTSKVSNSEDTEKVSSSKDTPRSKDTWQFGMSIWLFYGLSILVRYFLPAEDYRDIITWVLAFATGITMLFYRKYSNIWILFLVGFALLPILIFVGLLIREVEADKLGSIVGDFFLISASFGTIVALGGISAAAMSKHISIRQFNLSSLFDWFDTAETGFDRLGKLILKISVIISALISLISLISSSE